MSAYPLWTQGELDRLADLRAAGLSFVECARRLGRSKDSVRSRLRSNLVEAGEKLHIGRGTSEAKELGLGLFRDDEHVEICRRQGGFKALSERRGPRGQVWVCLPIIEPQVSQ